MLDAVEAGPLTLAGLVEATGLSRATAHRLAVALEVHGLVGRDARRPVRPRPPPHRPRPARRWPGPRWRRCATRRARASSSTCAGATAGCAWRRWSRPTACARSCPWACRCPLDVGSAGKVLAGRGARRSWAQSVEERERGVASVSAPVRDGSGARSWPPSRCRARSSAPPGRRAAATPAPCSKPRRRRRRPSAADVLRLRAVGLHAVVEHRPRRGVQLAGVVGLRPWSTRTT